MNRDRVAKRIAEGEVPPERAVLRREGDGYSRRLQFLMQRIGVIAAEPQSNAPAQLSCSRFQIHERLSDREGSRLAVEDHRFRGLLQHRQAQPLAIEGSGSLKVFGLDADEIGTDQSGHGCLLGME